MSDQKTTRWLWREVIHAVRSYFAPIVWLWSLAHGR